MVCLYQDCTTQNIPTTQLCELHKCIIPKCNNEHNDKTKWCDKHWRKKQNEKRLRTKHIKKQNDQKHGSPLIKTRAQKQALQKAQTQIQSPKYPNNLSPTTTSKSQCTNDEFNKFDQYQNNYHPTDYDQTMSQFSFVFPSILPPSPMKNENTSNTPNLNFTSPSNSVSSTKSTKSCVTHITYNLNNKQITPNVQTETKPTTPPTTKKEKNKMKSTIKIDKTLSKLNMDMEFHSSIWDMNKQKQSNDQITKPKASLDSFLSRHHIYQEKIQKIQDWENKQQAKEKKLKDKEKKKIEKEKIKLRKQAKIIKNNSKQNTTSTPPSTQNKKIKNLLKKQEDEEKAETTTYSISRTAQTPQDTNSKENAITEKDKNIRELHEINQLQKEIIELNKYKSTTENLVEEMKNKINKLEKQIKHN